MNAGKKQLPINLNPAVKVYTTHAYHLSIAAGHTDFMPWFCSNYLHLMSFMDFSHSPHVPLNFYLGTIAWDFNLYRSMPLIDRQVITRTTLRDIFRKSVIEFIKESIQANCYVYLHVNDYYIEGRPNWKQTHEILVYGYDDERKTVDAVSYFGEFYSSRALRYADFQLAYDSLEPEQKFQNIYMLSVSPNRFYRVDARFMQKELGLFLNADTTEVEAAFGHLRNPRDLQVFGKRCYTYMRANVRQYMKDVRPLHLLWEHKNCMLTRLDHLQEHGLISERDKETLSDGFNTIASQLLAARNMQIKNMVFAKAGLESAIVRTLHEVEEREDELMRTMIAALRPACRSFTEYVKNRLSTARMTAYDLSALADVPTDALLQMLNNAMLPWELGPRQLKQLAASLRIHPALLEQLLVNEALDPLMCAKLPELGEPGMSLYAAEHYSKRMACIMEAHSAATAL